MSETETLDRVALTSLDEANQAVFDDDRALRVQPRAPAPTEFYYLNEHGNWVNRTVGQSTVIPVRAKEFRQSVTRAIGKTVRAVEDDTSRSVACCHSVPKSTAKPTEV